MTNGIACSGSETPAPQTPNPRMRSTPSIQGVISIASAAPSVAATCRPLATGGGADGSAPEIAEGPNHAATQNSPMVGATFIAELLVESGAEERTRAVLTQNTMIVRPRYDDKNEPDRTP